MYKFYLEDPEQGKPALRSDIFLVIWREFKTHGIEIPYPQREVRLLANPAAPAARNKSSDIPE